MFDDPAVSTDSWTGQRARLDKSPEDKEDSQTVLTLQQIISQLFVYIYMILFLSISELWTLGWSPMIDLDTLAFPSIPIDYLQDHDILEIYLKRLLLLGWRSRKQFEESWMALLGVFSL